ncbi:hypothetical protein BS47DRAFT_1358009 [Hydnum rufescens UP504]|uniref:Monocarboxylate transporter n=1 Tax=Hydnum rufescens UP504 TaxID=1448309 RepID=A0A9P6B9D2_9AGAM|nr:hypothetical protein BS47DRAFT_1358009 [Hydnum rufescens UP504]
MTAPDLDDEKLPSAVDQAPSPIDGDITLEAGPYLQGEDQSQKDGEFSPARIEAPPLSPDEIYFPEGGLRAWSVLFGSHSPLPLVGSASILYVFQEYYQRTLLKDQSHSTIAWIGSVQYCLVFFPGLVSGRLFDIGYLRGPLFLASVFFIFCVFMIAQCTEYWQLMIVHGISLGIASGFLWGPAMPVVSHYFYKRRGLAYGIATIGSSAGGTVLPIAVRRLLPVVGFRWTMRIMAFLFVATLGIANITLRRRLPPKNAKGGLFNFPAFKNMPYTLYTASACIGFLGIYTVLIYIDSAAVAAGIDPDISFYLVAIANASSTLGRLGPGLLANRLGAVNILVFFASIAGIMTFAWPFAKTLASLLAIAILYGLCSIGALCGPPISGVIHDSAGGYAAVGYYAGSMIILGCALMLASKVVATGRIGGLF